MARTELLGFVERALRRATLGVDVDADVCPPLSRRQALGALAIGLAGCAAPMSSAPAGGGVHTARPDPSSPRVAIFGAGLAGLTCAHRLRRAGVYARVFEATQRCGGRVWTHGQGLRGGQQAELGGEFIDTGHGALRALVQELGLTLDDLTADQAGLRADVVLIGGEVLTERAIVEAFVPVAARMRQDLAASERDEAVFARLDETPLDRYLEGLPDIDARLRKLLEVAYVGEYGREASEQSAFNLLWLIDAAKPDPFRVFGDSDERYHVRGGNGAVARALADGLTGQIELEQRLLRVRERHTGFRVALEGPGGTRELDFDHVVLALPFTALREVELDVALPPDKREMIAQLGYGTNAKLMLQFAERSWRTRHRASGSSFTDNGLQSTWDSARGQAGAEGLLTVFLGGRAGLDVGAGEAEAQAQARLPLIEQLFPGSGAAYLASSALRMHWASVPWARGSYACYLPGQARYSGSEGEPVGALHFAGEHTSEEFQGYMNGAVESGERVAREILPRALLQRPTAA